MQSLLTRSTFSHLQFLTAKRTLPLLNPPHSVLVEVNASTSCNVQMCGVPVENSAHKQVSIYQARFFF